MLVRLDRFVDGTFAWAVGEGVMARLLIELQMRVLEGVPTERR